MEGENFNKIEPNSLPEEVKISSNESIEKKPTLIEKYIPKYQELQDKLDKLKEKTASWIDIASHELPLSSSILTLEELNKKVSSLYTYGNYIPDEEISKIQLILSEAKAAKMYYMEKSTPVIEPYPENSTEAKFKLQREELSKLKHSNGIKKLFSGGKEKKLKEKIKSTANTLQDEEQQRNDAWNLANNYEYDIIRYLHNTLGRVIDNKIKFSISEVKSEYQNFISTISNDPQVRIEIGKNFINNIVLPLLEESKREEYVKLTEEFITNIEKNTFSDRNQLQTLQKKISEITPDAIKYKRIIEDVLKEMQNPESSIKYSIIEPLLSQTYNTKIQEVIDLREKYSFTHRMEYLHPGDFIISSRSWRNNDDYVKEIINGDLHFWVGVKETSLFKNLAEDDINTIDKSVNEKLINNALSDYEGSEIDKLLLLPNSKTLETLIILAASKPYGHRIHHANGTINFLSQRHDWHSLVKQTVQNSSSLELMEDTLLGWNLESLNYDDNYPGLKEDSQEYLLSLLKDKKNKEVFETVLLGISTDNLISYFASEVDIKDKNLQILKETLDLKIIYDEFSQFKYDLKKILENTIRDILNEDSPNIEDKDEEFDLNKKLKNDNFLKLDALILLCEKINENKENEGILNYIGNPELVTMLDSGIFSKDTYSLFESLIDAHQYIPALKNDHFIRYAFLSNALLFPTINDQIWFNEFSNNFTDIFKQNLDPFLKNIRVNNITKERSLEIAEKYSELISKKIFSKALEYSQVFLQTNEDIEYYGKFIELFANQKIDILCYALKDNRISKDILIKIPERISALLEEKNQSLFHFIINHGNTLLSDESDYKFINDVIHQYGNKAIDIIEGYNECLRSNVINPKDKNLILEFLQRFQVLSPILMESFIKAKKDSLEEIFFSDLISISSKMTGGGIISSKEKGKPYYTDLIKHVYQNNAGQWSSYESNASCEDRSQDLKDFNIKPVYKIDLLSLSEVKLKEGTSLDTVKVDNLERPILEFAKIASSYNYDKEQITSYLEKKIDGILSNINDNDSIKELRSIEEKLLFIIGDSFYNNKYLNIDDLKSLLISYEFTTNDDIQAYMNGTTDRVKRALNMDYALLTELHSFYYDKMKESLRKIIEIGSENPLFDQLHSQYFNNLQLRKTEENRTERTNKAQIDKLGLSNSFLIQIQKFLNSYSKKSDTPNRTYSLERVRDLINRYENITRGSQNETGSRKGRTRGFIGQLKKQRNETFRALSEFSNKDIDIEEFRLAEFDVTQLIEGEVNINEGTYNTDQFLNYIGIQFLTTFEDEKLAIEIEINKYVSESGSQRELLNGYITKSKESANARMVGGVCVSGDNPADNHGYQRRENMWNMENYFQLVLSEPDTHKCQGLVLLHHFTDDNGKKILAASLNPSSTYINSIDQRGLFRGLMNVLEEFAQNNNFDSIVISNNKTIRTNRTGTDFEKEMDKKIGEVNKRYTFSDDKQFSFSPNYKLHDMDIVWEKPLQ